MHVYFRISSTDFNGINLSKAMVYWIQILHDAILIFICIFLYCHVLAFHSPPPLYYKQWSFWWRWIASFLFKFNQEKCIQGHFPMIEKCGESGRRDQSYHEGGYKFSCWPSILLKKVTAREDSKLSSELTIAKGLPNRVSGKADKEPLITHNTT